MNWARVKTILIIVFLIVNIFLLFKVNQKYSQKELKAEEISNLKNLLSSNEIVLEAALPAQIKLLPRMKVTNYIVEENQTTNKILGTSKWKVINNGVEQIYSSDRKQLKYDGNGFVEYTIDIGKEEALKLLSNEIKAKEVIRNTLNKYLKLDKYTEGNVSRSKNGIIIEYLYFSNKSEILNNYINVNVIPEGEIIIRQGLIEDNGFTSKSKKITPVDMIIELVRVLKDKGKTTVKEISIGYYADLNKANEIVRFGEADPAWKVKTDRGTFIFDAYTGIMKARF
ncbi:MAG: two-component system regulatory protein YycI [Deltaproteobacteria bacterium]